MPKRTKPRDVKERRILRATERLLATKGFHGISMEDIARAAEVPRPNLYYYFPTKEHIYRRIIAELRQEWIAALDLIDRDSEPRAAISGYIRAKFDYSRKHPVASKIFAMEVISDADTLTKQEKADIRRLTEEKCAVVDAWVAQGKMGPIDARHLFFLLWGATQYYADFEQLVKSILGVRRLTKEHFEAGIATVTRLTLSGCGLDP